MGNMNWLKREELLRGLLEIVGASSAEFEHGPVFAKTFYPVPEHTKVFDPDVVLITGGHGTGKSELFNAVVVEKLLPAIARWIPGSRLPLDSIDRISWLAGYPLDIHFADAAGLRRFVGTTGQALDPVSDLWFAYLVRVLKDKLSATSQSDLAALLTPGGGDIDAIYEAFRQHRTDCLLALDQLDQSLRETDRWIFVNYDELDTVAGADWEVMALVIRGLIGFWANYARRWRKIRAKIFLRTDLFQKYASVFSADFAKLAANRVELLWSPRNLYAMLGKRLLNANDTLKEYSQETLIRVESDSTLGLIPIFENVDAARPLIERLAGPYMGANIKKGRTFTWILDHLADGKGNVTPRALVSLLGKSAGEELASRRAEGERLLHPTSIRRALDQVSKDYVSTLQNREFPWLRGVFDRVQGTVVPIGREEMERLLAVDWEKSWGVEPDIRPLAYTPRELVNDLIGLGIFHLRPDGHVDTPDLFLAGLGLKRKGGVKRR
jgi:hypothetical protein